jgi:hypothetical protein
MACWMSSLFVRAMLGAVLLFIVGIRDPALLDTEEVNVRR